MMDDLKRAREMPGEKVTRVLVVDDTPEIRRTVRMVLEMLGGWEVVTAEDGQEAVEVALSEPPNVIVMDVQMPRLDGVSAFHQLRQHEATQKIPVVFLTAKSQVDDLMPLLDQGATAILNKPFDPLFLASEVARALGVTLPAQETRL